ncbi:hypothetical protein [Streptomyces sp. 8N706]|uniref:hypothetical protein n=1 Tax=Streptomyces sp. 8N706 TaxID=3457416 RepID=UPI003FCF6D37
MGSRLNCRTQEDDRRGHRGGVRRLLCGVRVRRYGVAGCEILAGARELRMVTYAAQHAASNPE